MTTEEKTKKTPSKKYSMDKLKKSIDINKPHYIMLMGSRNIGKSYQVKQYMLEKYYLDPNAELVYLRRNDVDIKTDLAQGYWADMPISEITEGTWDTVIVYQGKIYFARYDDEGRICEKKQFGWVHALNLATHYKSVMFPKVEDIVFEEYIPDGKPYLPDEPLKLQEYVSTIFRDKEGTCWMVGNKISRLNVYGADWHLDGILRMKPGQIDLYTQTVKVMTEDGMQEHDVKILVEQCKGEGIMSKMAFGSGANQIITNEYRRFEQPTIKADFAEQCDCIYTMYMMYKELTFKLQFLRISETEYIWYVKPGKNGLKLEDLTDQRVITDVVDYNPLHTRMQTVSPKEKRVFEYFGRQKVFYSDDQTGTDFKQCYRALL